MRRLAPVLLASLALMSCERAAPDPRGVDRDETLLTVTASGRADTRPDEAHLQLGVESQAASAGEAARLNREKMARVTAALSKLGVRADDLQTRNLSLSRIDYGAERGRYRAYNMVEVTMRDMAHVGDAVTAVTEAGANVLSGPDLRVSNREAANKSAYANAYRAARARAEAYAQAADLKIARVLGIYDGGGSGVAIAPMAPPPPPMVRNMSVETSAPAPFSPGVNSAEVRVRVDFALER